MNPPTFGSSRYGLKLSKVTLEGLIHDPTPRTYRKPNWIARTFFDLFRTPFRKNPSVPLLSGEFGERARGVRLYLRETLALVNVG